MPFLVLTTADKRGGGRLGEVGLNQVRDCGKLRVDSIDILGVNDHKVIRFRAGVSMPETPFDSKILIRSNLTRSRVITHQYFDELYSTSSSST